ncbi:MAG: hypothetical protein AAB396_02670 [Patescibacteria group bacterium]
MTITIGLLLIMVIMFAITGCMANIEEVIKLNKADYDALIKRKLSLEGEIKEERDKQRECLSKVEESKKQNEEKKIILLLDGKIKFEIELGAVMDYEELLLLKMISDPKFKEIVEKKGADADMAMLVFLRQISSDDRRITKEEIEVYTDNYQSI